MGLPVRKKRFTPEEYYALERDAEYKSEYYDGEIFAMAGGTDRHSAIIFNIYVAVGVRLKGSPCKMRQSDLRLKVLATGLITYPDGAIYCGKMEFDERDVQSTATNPTAIVEVLSKSTEAHDRGFRFDNFRQIPSLKAYVLASQNAPHVEVFERQADNSWALRDYRGLDAVAKIPGPQIDLPLSEIYDGIDFSTAE